MRLAFLASGFADYSTGLANALSAVCEVALFADGGALAREGVEAPRCTEGRLFRQDSRLHRWGGLPRLIAALARFAPHAILAHEHAHPHLTRLLQAASRLAPLGLIVHDPQPHPGRDQAFAELRSAEISRQRALATELFTHDNAGAALLRRLTARTPWIIPHGPILRPDQPPRPPPGGRRVLIFGRMEAYKGLETALEAHRLLRAAHVPLLLELRGEGPELARLADPFLDAGACEVVHGYASRASLLDALAGCDLVLAPYLQASGSGVAAAAMANGRGLVASAVGGLGEVVHPGVNGFVVPPGDPALLAEALAVALPRATALADGALGLSKGPFAWASAAKVIHDRLLLATRPGRAA